MAQVISTENHALGEDNFKGLDPNQRTDFTAMGPARLAVDTTKQEG